MILDCSHHYCRICGWHKGTGHEAGCSEGAYEERMRKIYEKEKQRRAREALASFRAGGNDGC